MFTEAEFLNDALFLNAITGSLRSYKLGSSEMATKMFDIQLRAESQQRLILVRSCQASMDVPQAGLIHTDGDDSWS